MRVMVIVKATDNSEAGVLPSEKLLVEMGRFNQELERAGVLLAGEGLHPSARGKRVRFAGGKRIVTDGPFPETKELIAGFWLWRVESMEQALEWLARCPHPMPGEEAVIEIRPVYEPEDFAPVLTPELRAEEERLRARLEAAASLSRAAGPGAPPAPAKIQAHLWYAREAEEAARFYASIFPDSRVDSVTAIPTETPSGPPGSVKVVRFTLFGQPFMAIAAGPHHEFNDAISFVVSCDDQAELDRYWNALLEGGGKPVACGWLVDRYGVRWQLQPARLGAWMESGDPARARRVMDALLKMVKPDLAALERAYRG